MAMQFMTHFGFRYRGEVECREELEEEKYVFKGWLLVLFVLALTVFFFFSFSLM